MKRSFILKTVLSILIIVGAVMCSSCASPFGTDDSSYFDSSRPDLRGAYNTCCNGAYYATLASDGSYLEIDTNPSNIDDYTASGSVDAIKKTNKYLGLPDSVYNKMLQTTALQGVQKHETENLVVSWTYHPDNGLCVIYEVK